MVTEMQPELHAVRHPFAEAHDPFEQSVGDLVEIDPAVPVEDAELCGEVPLDGEFVVGHRIDDFVDLLLQPLLV